MKKLVILATALLVSLSVSAQDVAATAKAAVESYNTKNYADAAKQFETVISVGEDLPDEAENVIQAKSLLPKCYFMLGGMAVKASNWAEALVNFEKSAAVAAKFKDASAESRAKGWVAKVYQSQGADAYNKKDYAAAALVFAKGYAADPRNTEMALNLAMSYCESGEYAKGMDVYEDIAALTNPKYEADVVTANKMMGIYTNNEVAKKQQSGDYAGIIAMADVMLTKNPKNAVAQKVRLQAYSDKKDYAKVIELGEEAAAAQVDPEDKSLVYFALGAAYNAKEMKPQAIAAFKKVVAGPAVAPAKAALTELAK